MMLIIVQISVGYPEALEEMMDYFILKVQMLISGLLPQIKTGP
jgi:hypothetical protein